MITSLHGKLIEALPTQVVMDVHGVGYEVLIPLSSFDKLPKPGGEVKLLTQLIVREDGKDVNPKAWTPAHVALIKAAAEEGVRSLAWAAAILSVTRGDSSAWKGIDALAGTASQNRRRTGCPLRACASARVARAGSRSAKVSRRSPTMSASLSGTASATASNMSAMLRGTWFPLPVCGRS